MIKNFIYALIPAAGFIGCATSNETAFDNGVTVPEDSGTTCNLNNCPTPGVPGTIKCCTTSKTCGYKATEAGACYVFDAGKDGSSGSGGSSN